MLKPRIEDDMTHRMTDLAAVETPSQVWRPISTAPRDGSEFLAAQDGEIYQCRWHEEECDGGYAPSKGWYDLVGRSFEQPTHWRPLPPPPSAQPDPIPVPSTDATGGTTVEGASQAERDVLGERRRQIAAEGWTPKHDDEHGDGEMALAAACYVMPKHQRHKIMVHTMGVGFKDLVQRLWPWDVAWWKPKDVRSDLVRAGALILAEIERLDRAAARRAAARAALRSDQGGH